MSNGGAVEHEEVDEAHDSAETVRATVLLC